MIRAVAAAFIFVWSGFYTTFLQQTFNGDYSMRCGWRTFFPVTMVFVAFIINMLFIPQITQAIFGGAAGATASAQNLVRAWHCAMEESSRDELAQDWDLRIEHDGWTTVIPRYYVLRCSASERRTNQYGARPRRAHRRRTCWR